MKKIVLVLIVIALFCSCKNYPTIEEFTEEDIVITNLSRERGTFLINNQIWMHTTFWEKPVILNEDYEKLWLYHKLKVGDTIWVSKDVNEVHVRNKKGIKVYKHSHRHDTTN